MADRRRTAGAPGADADAVLLDVPPRARASPRRPATVRPRSATTGAICRPGATRSRRWPRTSRACAPSWRGSSAPAPGDDGVPHVGRGPVDASAVEDRTFARAVTTGRAQSGDVSRAGGADGGWRPGAVQRVSTEIGQSARYAVARPRPLDARSPPQKRLRRVSAAACLGRYPPAEEAGRGNPAPTHLVRGALRGVLHRHDPEGRLPVMPFSVPVAGASSVDTSLVDDRVELQRTGPTPTPLQPPGRGPPAASYAAS